MDELINTGILKHPINWVTVPVLLAIYLIALHLVSDFISKRTATPAP